MTFTVTLNQTNNTGSDITFDLADTGTGSATSGEDYTAIPAGAQIRVAEGSETGSLTVQVSEDTSVERTRTVVAVISNPSNSEVTIDTATAEIADDGGSPRAMGKFIAWTTATPITWFLCRCFRTAARS